MDPKVQAHEDQWELMDEELDRPGLGRACCPGCTPLTITAMASTAHTG
jgi:hypothetical protein